MTAVNAIVVAAMDEEMKPLRALLREFRFTTLRAPFGTSMIARKGRSSLLFLTSGIGMTCASALLSWALSRFEPRVVVSIGSAGGLDTQLKVGDVVFGSRYVHAGADATAFGYKIGQIPGQPEFFEVEDSFYQAAQSLVELGEEYSNLHIGTMASSDQFVTEDNVGNLREAFPGVLCADMESQALAQTCALFDIPFASVRSISDVVGAEKAENQAKTFDAELEQSAANSACVALELLFRTSALDIVRSGHGPAQHFDKASLEAALHLMLAKARGLEPVDRIELSSSVASYLQGLPPEVCESVSGYIEAGRRLVQSDPSVTLTAKDYDTQRAQFVADYDSRLAPAFKWPPTSQTVIKRYNGFWNDALKSIGLKPQRGRSRGGLKFSAEDYLFAIRSYIIDSQREGRSPAFNGYTQWLKDSGNAGKLPSGAAIRQRYGSWKEALSSANIRATDFV